MGEATDPTTGFKCNICGARCFVAASQLHREVASCEKCGSTPRARAIIRALSLGLFGQVIVLTDFPVDRTISGLGMSDWEGYAAKLAEKFWYTNTYYHKEPRLDISKAVPAGLIQSSDFVISSEVFEHIAPPVMRAFQHTFEILKPGGVFVLTVPYGNWLETIEHFPDLYDFTIVADNDNYRLKNVTRSGEVQEFHDLVFHSGAGATLEMRVFGEAALLRQLTEAGFDKIIVHREPDLLHGISWPEPWSFPISARRPSAK